ncbi:hypothetical protein N8E89_24020 (plasmid) [Phyllobacterium sp. A18/5-2]|uniref:hypothetical protein n=1 Tax=Phyllobacterium sp. A18/5-2 TaxID=2978392 RepID=UPI0021C5D07D|nr:hypothetical protein [Phyllobacterium sp. A18/5-2]UXN66247.1 hypothetical protein N8E89_24020 [Phyllobacterium sp. A18/5-2]
MHKSWGKRRESKNPADLHLFFVGVALAGAVVLTGKPPLNTLYVTPMGRRVLSTHSCVPKKFQGPGSILPSQN